MVRSTARNVGRRLGSQAAASTVRVRRQAGEVQRPRAQGAVLDARHCPSAPIRRESPGATS